MFSMNSLLVQFCLKWQCSYLFRYALEHKTYASPSLKSAIKTNDVIPVSPSGRTVALRKFFCWQTGELQCHPVKTVYLLRRKSCARFGLIFSIFLLCQAKTSDENKMCLWNTIPPIMANSNKGQDHKDKYFDTSRKILPQEMTMCNMEALVSYL